MRAVVISGLSGSGKSSAIRALEDAGYYCIDNLPVPLLPPFLDLWQSSRGDIVKIALGIDARDRAFIKGLPGMLQRLSAAGHTFDLVFLTASDEVLSRRFSETRRRHPLAGSGGVADGIRKERELLEPVLSLSNQVLDTSAMTPHDLRNHMLKMYGAARKTQTLSAQVITFGYKHGLPPNADLVLDVRFLANPYFREELKGKTGLDREVIDFVMRQDDAKDLLRNYERLLKFLLPRYDREGKSYLAVGVGCTGGRHRSVVLGDEIGGILKGMGYHVTVTHRDLEKP